MCIRDRFSSSKSSLSSSEDISTNVGPEESLLEQAETTKKNKNKMINLLLIFNIYRNISIKNYTLLEYFMEHSVQIKLAMLMPLL